MMTQQPTTSAPAWMDTLLNEYSHAPPHRPGIKSTLQQFLSRRVINSLGCAACALILAFAYYLEYAKGLQPCSLCVVQRLLIAILGIVFLVAAMWNPRPESARRYGALIALVAGLGVLAAGYQIWLQNPSIPVPSFCPPPLSYLLATFSPGEVLATVLRSPGGCGEIQWTFLGLSLPVWACLGFVGLGAAGVGQGRLLD